MTRNEGLQGSASIAEAIEQRPQPALEPKPPQGGLKDTLVNASGWLMTILEDPCQRFRHFAAKLNSDKRVLGHPCRRLGPSHKADIALRFAF